ncbi:MAG TPA: glutamine amidotransferase [Sedimentisphaerales bacterium]|nr:glutamine amidotransferase [Sedimentisphaerales bacterium]
MPLGSIFIPSSPWDWPAVLVLVVALVVLLWSYRRSVELGAAHKIAFFLRLLGVLALALCLIEPLWSGKRVKSGANIFLVVADNSSGMNVLDRGASQSRGQILKTALQDEQSDWLTTLAGSFQVRQYLFDSQLRRATDFSELVFDGKASAIGETLQTIAQRYHGRPLAGVLLMTDGNATDTGEQLYDLSGVPPVYPVAIGSAQPPRDISLANVSVSQTAFEDAPVTIQADVEASGYAGKTVSLALTESSGQTVERQTYSISRDVEKQAFRFRLRPDRTGVLFYHLDVAEEVPPNQSSDEQQVQPEATSANNRYTFVVDRGREPHRILYVSGRPNWEYKFLRRALAEDEQVQLVGLLRVARREPKYDWRGRRGEQTNPLYRGFDPKEPEQAEQYDQPVLVRMYPSGPEDPAELRDGFPKTAEDLFRYQAIILDDVEAAFFTHDQMDLLRRFVAERGGGFLMLGGKESFREGEFQRTPIGRMLPVHLDPTETQAVARVHLNMTREGLLQPWARLRDNEQDERKRLSEMPAFGVLNQVGSIKAGASVVATVGAEAAQLWPALTVQRYGNGRSAALTVGDLWRWGLKDAQLHEDMDKFWRQTVRWLVADVPNRISLAAVQKPDQVNQAVVFQARVRQKDFSPMDNVSVAIEVTDPNGRMMQLSTEPVLDEAGLFEATYIPRDNGGYSARAVVSDADGLQVGDAQTGWAVALEAREFRSIATNRPLLEKIARQTGGRMVELDALDSFARTLPRRQAPITETSITPLWDLRGVLPAVFAFVLMCFLGEWALRRWKGLP